MKEVTRRSFLGGTAAAVAVTGVSAAEAKGLEQQAGLDFMIVFLETAPDSDESFTVEDLNNVLELVQYSLEPTPGKKRAAVMQLPPGMTARVVGGSDGAIRELRKVMVAQTI